MRGDDFGERAAAYFPTDVFHFVAAGREMCDAERLRIAGVAGVTQGVAAMRRVRGVACVEPRGTCEGRTLHAQLRAVVAGETERVVILHGDLDHGLRGEDEVIVITI